jgi:hypothetical protein
MPSKHSHRDGYENGTHLFSGESGHSRISVPSALHPREQEHDATDMRAWVRSIGDCVKMGRLGVVGQFES